MLPLRRMPSSVRSYEVQVDCDRGGEDEDAGSADNADKTSTVSSSNRTTFIFQRSSSTGTTVEAQKQHCVMACFALVQVVISPLIVAPNTSSSMPVVSCTELVVIADELVLKNHKCVEQSAQKEEEQQQPNERSLSEDGGEEKVGEVCSVLQCVSCVPVLRKVRSFSIN